MKKTCEACRQPLPTPTFQPGDTVKSNLSGKGGVVTVDRALTRVYGEPGEGEVRFISFQNGLSYTQQAHRLTLVTRARS